MLFEGAEVSPRQSPGSDETAKNATYANPAAESRYIRRPLSRVGRLVLPEPLRPMKPPFTTVVLTGFLALTGFCLVSSGSGEKSHKLTQVSLRKMADGLHASLAASREVYVRELVERLAVEAKVLGVGGDWRASKSLPGHAEFMRLTASTIQKRGAEFSFVLRSSWPMDARNGPQTDVEQKGLEAVRQKPEENVYTEELLGGRSYFTAIYPDRAILSSCVDCHNRHPASPRRDFATNDVMGAWVIRLPLEF